MRSYCSRCGERFERGGMFEASVAPSTLPDGGWGRYGFDPRLICSECIDELAPQMRAVIDETVTALWSSGRGAALRDADECVVIALRPAP